MDFPTTIREAEKVIDTIKSAALRARAEDAEWSHFDGNISQRELLQTVAKLAAEDKKAAGG